MSGFDDTSNDNIEEKVKENVDEKSNIEDGKVDVDSDLDKIKSENLILKDKYLRLLADFENYKKRSSQERIDISFYVESSILREMLSINDDFERALSAEPNNEGIKIIKSKFDKIFEKRGVMKVKTNIGDEFNPDLHEAISKEVVVDKNLDGKIVKVIENAFLFNSKILRFAKVIIGMYNEK